MVDFRKIKYKEALHDHCGVFGIYALGEKVAKITYFALHSLQHRGQEGAGIAVSDGKKLRSIKNLGLVTSVFNEENLTRLKVDRGGRSSGDFFLAYPASLPQK